jgi:uncharacterized repeat protein (TIGR01451 family)
MKTKLLLLLAFALFFNFSIAQNEVQVVSQNVLCNGQNNGSISVINPIGQGPNLYSIDGINYVSSNQFTNLSVGNYTVSVKDANNVVNSTQVVITQPSPLLITAIISGNNIFATTNGGGSPPYVYSLSTSQGTPIVTSQTSSSFTIFTPGNYNVIVQDANGCLATTTVTLNTIAANDDVFTVPPGGISPSVLINDILNGISNLTQNQVVLTLVNPPQAQLQITPQGNILVPQSTPAGTYVLTYQICSVQDPNNCDIANAVIQVPSNASISLSAVGTYTDYNNDGFTNIGDVINYQYTVTNSGQEILSNVQVYFNQLPVTGGPLASFSVGAINNTTFTRTYVITQADINAGYVYAGAYVTALFNNQQVANDFGSQTPLNISNGIKFNLFFDTNSNGAQDGQEANYNGGNFSYQLNSGVIHSVSSNNGMFTLYENNASNSYNLGCSLSPILNNCNNGYTLATTSYNNVSVANGSGITTYNFPITTAPCADLSINLYQYGAPPRPGFTYINRIQYTNNGNQNITSGTITFTRSTTVSAVSTLPVTTANATGFTYNFTNLLAGETRYIDVTMQVPTIPTVSLGDLVTNLVSASIPPNDAYPANNSASLTKVIVGSYDPNDKTETHGGKILFSSFSANDYLTYKIQFENTGTAEAVNIRVNDVLDAKLNPNIIRMVAASHPYVLDRVGNTLSWKFNGVNLPPSVANTNTGKGYVVFQIKPTAGYSVGTIIPNIANIFFDFNPAIVTAPCTTQFVSTLAINDFDANELSVYPNPVKNNLTITNSIKIDSVNVLSVLGQEVMNQKVNALLAEINTSGLTNGVYFVKVTSEGKEKTVKILKE